MVFVHFGLATTLSFVTPIFEAPDEPNHYLFVRYVQAYQALPVQTLDRDGPRAHHPPLYYLVAALVSGWVVIPDAPNQITMTDHPQFWFRYDDPDPAHKTRWLHNGPAERWPYTGQTLAVHLIRLVSVCGSTLAVWGTYLMARALRPMDTLFAGLATSLMAFSPLVLSTSSVINNDSLSVAACAGLFAWVSTTFHRKSTPARWVVAGVMYSVGVLSKSGAIPLAAPVALALVFEAWQARSVKTFVLHSLSFGLPVLVLTGWWFARNQSLYGDLTGNAVIQALWADDASHKAFVPHLFWTGLVGRFGYDGLLSFPPPVYSAAYLFGGIALAGAVWGGGRAMRRWSSLTVEHLLWAMHVLTLGVVIAALAFYAVTTAWNSRYLLTAFPSLACLLAGGVLAIRRSIGLTLGLIGLNAALAFYALFGVVWPAYALPRAPLPGELRLATPLDAQLDATAQLLGYRLSATTLRPGETLYVTVYWHILARTETPYTIFIHLFSPEAGSLAQRDVYPGLGNYATTIWDAERTVVETYPLVMPQNLLPTDHAQILLGLYDQTTGQRLPVQGADTSPENSWAEFGVLTLQP